MLTEWAPNRIWYCDAITGSGVSKRLQRMVVIRLAGDKLVVLSPTELTTALQLELSKLGTIKAIATLSPDEHHNLSDWWLAYSQARFLATPTLIQKRSDLNFDAALGTESAPCWQGELLQTAVLGIRQPRKILLCDPQSRTLLLPDLLVGNQPHLPGPQKLRAMLEGGYREFKLPLKDRLAIDNPALLRASIQQVMTWPFDKLISSNGLCIEKDARQAFYHAFWCAFH